MELLPELGQELISPREPRIIYVSALWGFFYLYVNLRC